MKQPSIIALKFRKIKINKKNCALKAKVYINKYYFLLLHFFYIIQLSSLKIKASHYNLCEFG